MSDLRMEIRRQAASQELEAQIDLEASPQDVWRALTEAEELVRWFPLQAAVAPDGTLYVVDSGNFRVESFDPDGNFLSSFGSVGRFPGQFARPKGIAVDPAGNVYVVDTAFGNLQIFDRNGQLLMFLGERGEAGYPGKFMLPAGVDVDADGRVYMVDQFFRKVDVFRPANLGDNLPGTRAASR